MSDFYAYLHAKPDGTPFYVGKGKGRRAWKFKERNQRHTRTVSKYGVASILVGKLDCSSEKTAFELEIGLIKCLRRMGADLCNMTDGGEGAAGAKASADTRAKLSAMRKGKAHSPEWVAKRAAAKRGKGPNTEARQVLSERLKAHFALPENIERLREQATGRRLSPEARAKVSAANKGKVVSAETKAKTAAALRQWWAEKKARNAAT